MRNLLAALRVRERAMVSLDMSLGLRRGELAGLKWEDFDFDHLTVSVMRSLVDQHVGRCKAEVSKKLMPIDLYTTRDLRTWYMETPYKNPSDYDYRLATCMRESWEAVGVVEHNHAIPHIADRFQRMLQSHNGR